MQNKNDDPYSVLVAFAVVATSAVVSPGSVADGGAAGVPIGAMRPSDAR